MATLPRLQTVNSQNTRSFVSSFGPFATGDTSEVMPWGQFADRSLQIAGAFTGSISLMGSNDGTNFVVLTDPAGAAITLTAPGLVQVGPASAFVRIDATSVASGAPMAHLFLKE